MTFGLILPKYPEPKRRTGKHEDSRPSTVDLIVLDRLTKTLDFQRIIDGSSSTKIDKRRTKKNKKLHNHPLDFERLFFELSTDY
jgi:hypothetical protein